MKPITGVWFDKSSKSWKVGGGPGSPFGLDKAPEPSGRLILEDLQTLHIPYRGLGTIQSGYFFLSLVAT